MITSGYKYVPRIIISMRASEVNNMIQLILSQLSEKDKQQLKLQMSGETVEENVDNDAFMLIIIRGKYLGSRQHYLDNRSIVHN